jgi:hypothetical protein
MQNNDQKIDLNLIIKKYGTLYLKTKLLHTKDIAERSINY